MKVKDLHIDGFGVWSDLTVDALPDGMTLFYGPNEAGKTTVMQFLRSMFYGFTPQRRDKYLPPVFDGVPGGSIRLLGPGGGYQLRRHTSMTDQSCSGRLTIEGPDGQTQGQHRLTSLMGQIDEAIFTNVFAIGMRELQELGSLDNTAAADELYKLSSGLDRVSLVDVIRSLQHARQSIVGAEDNEANLEKLNTLVLRRDALREETRTLMVASRRYGELASLRQSQQQEVVDLKQRIESGEREIRIVEAAVSILEPWQQRKDLAKQITELNADADFPEEAPGKLVKIDSALEERQAKLDSVKEKRRAIREKAGQIPVSAQLMDLESRIEAAAEQSTWVEALEGQIEKINAQIVTAESDINSQADALGISAEDRPELIRGGDEAMPDLSRQTLAALARPAKRVKEQQFLLDQARSEGVQQKELLEKFQDELYDALERSETNDLQQGIRQRHKQLADLKRIAQLGQHIDKLKRHYRSLETESIDLATQEVLPLNRMLISGLVFIAGVCCLILFLAHLVPIRLFLYGEPNLMHGVFCLLIGVLCLTVWYFNDQNERRSTAGDLGEVDHQIETLRKQIRELEYEQNQIESELPASNHPIDARIRQTEALLGELEDAMPVFHAHAAAQHALQTAQEKATEASDGLRQAREEWSATLKRLGLSESLSPRSVRKLGEGYENLKGELARLQTLRLERDDRLRERKSLAARIDALYQEAQRIVQQDVAQLNNDESDELYDVPEDMSYQQESVQQVSHAGPLEQLHYLQEEVSRQRHWLKRRRELKEQDRQLKRQQASLARAIERGDQQRRSLWAKCGVVNAEQFYQRVDRKALLVDLTQQHDAVDQQLRSMIPANVSYDDVVKQVDGSTTADLEKRWDALTHRASETQQRIDTLQTQLGESAADMKHLAEDDRLMVAQLELACVQRKIDNQVERWQNLATTGFLVDQVCQKFERERQPETLREASSFLSQLTDGKYIRIWTPLGTNQLKIDQADGSVLNLNVLSRGTREAVFIALRLSLVASYARRGVTLPLVLDDVLVNFDGNRALHAAETLKTFAELGHQVMMFTCHEHIAQLFQSIDVQVRTLPAQGQPGRAEILEPLEQAAEAPETVEEPLLSEQEASNSHLEEVSDESDSIDEMEEILEGEPEQVVEEPEPPAALPLPKRKRKRSPRKDRQQVIPMDRLGDRAAAVDQEMTVDWMWFQREPADGRISDDERVAETINIHNRADVDPDLESAEATEQIPEEVWNRNAAWWDGHRVTT
jgi:uncharacterized protein YhaN